MTNYYKDAYGGSASIKETSAGTFKLTVRSAHGGLTIRKEYDTMRGARAAMSRTSDGWRAA